MCTSITEKFQYVPCLSGMQKVYFVWQLVPETFEIVLCPLLWLKKSQDDFPLHLISALQVCLCLSVNVDTLRILCLILSHLDILTLPKSLLRGGWLRRPNATFQTCLVQRLDLELASHRQPEKWCRKRASQVACQRLTTLGMTHYTAQIQSKVSGLSCEKRTLQSFSSQWPKAETFSK